MRGVWVKHIFTKTKMKKKKKDSKISTKDKYLCFDLWCRKPFQDFSIFPRFDLYFFPDILKSNENSCDLIWISFKFNNSTKDHKNTNFCIKLLWERYCFWEEVFFTIFFYIFLKPIMYGIHAGDHMFDFSK